MSRRRRPPEAARGLLIGLIVGVALVALASDPARVSAAGELNVTGVWHAAYHCEEGPCTSHERPVTLVLTQGAGFSEVTGYLEGAARAGFRGALNGQTLDLKGKAENGYEVNVSVTVSEDGLSWSGTYFDTKGTKGTFTATREATSRPGARPDSGYIRCRGGLPGGGYLCVVIVADASGQSPPQSPTGTVTFTATQGSFAPNPCKLEPLPGSPKQSSCTVTFTLPANATTRIEASYSGSSVFASRTKINGYVGGPRQEVAIQLLCNIGAASGSGSTCTALVASTETELFALSGPVPTGTVSFTATQGTLLGTQCSLVKDPHSVVAGCSVPYLPPPGGLPTGAVGYVTATYPGDGVYAPGSAVAGAGASTWPSVGGASETAEGAATTVSCPAGAKECPAKVKLTAEKKGGSASAAAAARTVIIGSTSVKLRGGQKRTVRVSLNRAGKKLISGHRRLLALLSVTSGKALLRTQRISLKVHRG